MGYDNKRDIEIVDLLKERISIDVTPMMRELLSKLDDSENDEDLYLEHLSSLRGEIIENLYVE